MKRLSILFLLFAFTYSNAQLVNYENIKGATKKPKANFTEYQSKNGEVFKVGDYITFGYPLKGNGEDYLHIISTDGFSSVHPVSITSKGFESEIKKFKVGGTKRQGYEVIAVGKTEYGMTNYWITIEDAIENGEIETSMLTRAQAIEKLKESKDLLDLEMMTQEEYDKIKLELTPIIKNN